MMKKLTLLMAAGLVAAATAHGAAAARTLSVSGTWTATDFGQTTCTQRGPLSICKTTGFVSVYTGDLTPSTRSDFVTVINCVTGRAIGAGTETLTGSVAGVGSGTLTWRIVFTGTFDTSDCATLTSFDGHGFVVGGTGALAGARGRLHFGGDGTYSGTLRFGRGDDD